MSDRIECKPTPWFLLRAGAMILMFGIFAAMFFKDGKWGYREKNLSYYTLQAFKRATDEFGERQGSMTPEQWREFAEEQEIRPPEDHAPLPVGTPESKPWPDMLHDYETVEAGMANWKTELFDAYRDKVGMSAKAPEQPYTERKILEQWIVFWICLALMIGAIFALLRTISRKMAVEGTTFQPAGGEPVDIGDLDRLDLRRWERKGLAFAWAKTPEGDERRIRIDGLTYGGFKEEDGEPAEKLMQRIKANFSGELIEYEEESADGEGGEKAGEGGGEEAPASGER